MGNRNQACRRLASAGLIFASLREALTMGCQRELVQWEQQEGAEGSERDG